MTKTEELYIQLIEVLKANRPVPRHLQRTLFTQWGKEIRASIQENREIEEKFRGKSEAIELALE